MANLSLTVSPSSFFCSVTLCVSRTRLLRAEGPVLCADADVARAGAGVGDAAFVRACACACAVGAGLATLGSGVGTCFGLAGTGREVVGIAARLGKEGEEGDGFLAAGADGDDVFLNLVGVGLNAPDGVILGDAGLLAGEMDFAGEVEIRGGDDVF